MTPVVCSVTSWGIRMKITRSPSSCHGNPVISIVHMWYQHLEEYLINGNFLSEVFSNDQNMPSTWHNDSVIYLHGTLSSFLHIHHPHFPWRTQTPGFQFTVHSPSCCTTQWRIAVRKIVLILLILLWGMLIKMITSTEGPPGQTSWGGGAGLYPPFRKPEFTVVYQFSEKPVFRKLLTFI